VRKAKSTIGSLCAQFSASSSDLKIFYSQVESLGLSVRLWVIKAAFSMTSKVDVIGPTQKKLFFLEKPT